MSKQWCKDNQWPNFQLTAALLISKFNAHVPLKLRLLILNYLNGRMILSSFWSNITMGVPRGYVSVS